ncbi:olfactory receptor-like protein OLF4 [Heptranchias perlo]|uniref:olfactory receptor-like protein OLF4 n=1 Tax=Heptranchias perlo TaxID=212740 RepID=UPI0035595F4D
MSEGEENATTGFILLGFIYSTDERHIIIPGLVLILALGLSANLLIFGIVHTKSSVRTPKNVLISHLCIIDVYGLLAFSPYLITRLALRNFDPITLEWCLVQYYFLNVYTCIATFAVTFMAVDRYYVICYPFIYEMKVTNERITKGVLLSWAFAVVYPTFYMFPFIGQEPCYLITSSSFLCTGISLEASLCSSSASVFPKFYRILMITVHLLGAAVMVAFSYVKILRESRSARLSESSRKALNTVITHGLVLIIFFCNASLLFITGSLRINTSTEESVMATLRLTADLLYLQLPPTFNPIIYGLRNKELRKEFLKFFRKRNGRVKASTAPAVVWKDRTLNIINIINHND